jgi:hypothetical protein
MVSEDPTSRPSALQALERVREIEWSMSVEMRQHKVPAIPEAEYSRRDAEARARDAEARARNAETRMVCEQKTITTDDFFHCRS